MANNYSCFADEFEFPEEAAKDLLATMNGLVERDVSLVPKEILDYMGFYSWLEQTGNEDEPEAEMFEAFIDEEFTAGFMGFNVAYENGRFYIASETESADYFATVLSAVMERHKIMTPVTLHEAWYCEKLRPNEFGGTAYAVGPGRVLVEDTVGAANRLAEELAKEFRPQAKPAGPRP